jgi:urea transporter/murein DD-endopeptidase MepM/ murein hydrolase activator NlpD
MQFFLDSTLFSYAQIFFSNRKWFGAAILIASFASPFIGLMALLGVLISNLAAFILKFDTEKIRSGFYGFNGILFGASTAFYFELNNLLLLLIPIFIIITFLISAVLEHHLETAFNLPGLSLPFIISVYIFVIFLTSYNHITPNIHQYGVDSTISSFTYYANIYLKSLSLIIFQPDITAGIIIIIAILIFSRVLFVLSIVSFLLNVLLLKFILPNHFDNLLILSSFNSILTAFALGGSLIIPSRKSFLLVIISSLMVVIFTGFFSRLLSGSLLPLLVLPFNFIVLATIYSLKFRKDQTDLVLLYFKPGSPEDNYYYHQKRKARFENFKYLFPELPFFGEWKVSQGFNGEHTHKDNWKYAWDFMVVDKNGSQFSNEGLNLEDYYCFGLPVISSLDGEVVRIVSSVRDNEPGEVNLQQNFGNTVIISHQYGLFSSISHLKSDSIKVKEGDKIKKGDMIGSCGNSGRSPYPHIHFQFQLNDKIGDKTHLFPISHFIDKESGNTFLQTFSYPKENSTVQNIDVHNIIKDAFNFKLGDKITFEYQVDGKAQTESWEVKVDIYNQLLIESSKNAMAEIYLTEKVFYITSYVGEKNTALYYFHLAAAQVPLCFQEELYWEDSYSISLLPVGAIRFLAEFFLFYKNMINAVGKFTFEEDDESKNYLIKSEIKILGSELFTFYKRQLNGVVRIDEQEGLKEFEVTENNNILFKAIKSK